jgi:hypothetical protein
MLSQDYDLKTSEIQQIAGEDGVAGLFTALGYDTAHCLKQTPEAMGFPEALAREVRLIDRIADHEQGALQVYLVEMKHVTVALTQALTRVFKNRAGLYLLILTTPDYERLDFVLLDPLPPEGGKPGSGIGSVQPVLHPRILTVERRNPDRVSLRVLRRFSFTEIDADYQWEKLRSAYGVADWSEPLFNNRALFSDYYLNERLPNRDEWKEDSKSAYRAFNSMFVGTREKFSGKPEEIIRAEFLEPAFNALGWIAEPGKGPKDESVKPDYWLKTQTGEKIPCLAYTWDRALDGPDEQRDPGTPHENPAQSVVSILEKLDSDATGWAIMTNGKTWRLYCARAHSRATNYFEIDLEETLASPDLADAFRYYWLLFRAKAFTGQPTFVDSILTESESYAKALGERLKDRVFEHVFPRFAEGFVEQQGKPAVKLTENELMETYHATLTFLYRILFLLYAEARDLLPVRETRGYWEISLKKMKEEIAAKAGIIEDQAPDRLKKAYSATSTDLYDHLNDLFIVIDKGKADLNVPVYNGGLFVTDANDESEETSAIRFLTKHKIPDRFLAMGLDLLARDIDEKTESLAMIDYKSLGVRQLGSIYEGLLEFKLRVAQEKMAVVAGKKNEEVVPYADAVKEERKIKIKGKRADRIEQIYHKGDPYLENDNHERKASGSYYTPDYIVKYIVQNTVGPALESKCEALRPRLREAQKAYHAAVERQKAFQKMGQKGDDPEKVANTFRSVVDELFDLRVLDPAMGSGHFLVEAVDVITDRLLAFLNAFPWNPVTAALRQTRQTILEEMQRQSVNVDPARLTDVNLLKRHVLKRCIYGVDLNPMAVELAKVSLWLDCFTLGAPLSFLDHHLKCGNSLIGARVQDVRNEIEIVTTTHLHKVAESAREYKKVQTTGQQMQMFGSMWTGAMLATDLMRQVGELPDTTAEQVRQSRSQYNDACDALVPFKRILDIYTSRWFGNNDTKKNQPVVDFLRDGMNIPWLKSPRVSHISLTTDSRQVAETALKAARKKRFFHWELEFPEVFFGASKASHQQIVMKENPGFDAVIANPPYISFGLGRVDTLADNEENYIRELYESAEYKISIYGLFLECGIKQIRQGGASGMIVPDSFLLGMYFSQLREFMLSQSKISRLIIFKKDFWESGDVGFPTILISKKAISKEDADTNIYGAFRCETPEDLITVESHLIHGKQAEFWKNERYRFMVLDSHSAYELINKIKNNTTPLQTLLGLHHGIRSKIGRDAIVSPDQKNDKWKKAIISSGEIHRFLLDPEENYIHVEPTILFSGGWDIHDIEQDKILIRRTGENIISTIDTNNYYHTNALIYGIPTELKKPPKLHYIVCLLNSILMDWFYRTTTMKTGRILPQVEIDTINYLPIHRITFSTPSARRDSLAHEVQMLVAAGNTSELLRFVTSRLIAQPEESDVVHDLLASLAKRMMDLNMQKQAEMKRFVVWLDGLLKISVDNLTGKSKLKNYLGDYQKNEPELTFPELEDILYKNKGKLGISLSDVRLMAKLRDEYEKSLTELRPIKSTLVWTDNLINQIVYRLYGLTEEEIKVVEGKK